MHTYMRRHTLTLTLSLTCMRSYIHACVHTCMHAYIQFRFDDKVEDGESGAFTPRMLKLLPSLWIKTFLEGVTDEDGTLVFNDLAWFAHKVVRVVTSASACEHSWSIEGWIHSKRRNRMKQPLVEMLVRAHTNLVLRANLQKAQEDILPWDIELVIDEPAENDASDSDE